MGSYLDVQLQVSMCKHVIHIHHYTIVPSYSKVQSYKQSVWILFELFQEKYLYVYNYQIIAIEARLNILFTNVPVVNLGF